jgi:hypothetical protein
MRGAEAVAVGPSGPLRKRMSAYEQEAQRVYHLGVQTVRGLHRPG